MTQINTFIVDTNVFLRFLTNDIEVQAKRAQDRFLQAEAGKIRLRVLLITVVEILFHLERWYKLPKTEAIEKIEDLFARAWLEVKHKEAFFLALQEYGQKNIDFVDLLTFYIASTGGEKLLSFDADFDKLDPTMRVKP